MDVEHYGFAMEKIETNFSNMEHQLGFNGNTEPNYLKNVRFYLGGIREKDGDNLKCIYHDNKYFFNTYGEEVEKIVNRIGKRNGLTYRDNCVCLTTERNIDMDCIEGILQKYISLYKILEYIPQ